MGGLFGTDGIRGVANVDLTPELALGVARAAAERMAPTGSRPRFLVGRDTRLSCDLLEGAVVAGLCSGGAEAVLGGIMPTPAVAHLVGALDFDGGIMISASHNPYEYNGLKLFGPGGRKLSVGAEEDIEARMGGFGDSQAASVGRVRADATLLESYVERLCAPVRGRLRGMRVVLDCANGAAFDAAPQVFWRLGANVAVVNCRPDGRNINAGGATCPEALARCVVEQKAEAGVAFDGDADRLSLTDENGNALDGDQILAIWARELAANERLGGTVVGTVLTNGGLEECLAEVGCRLIRAPVGDRHVAEAMRESGAVLGGEACGHVIHAPHAWCSDAIYAAIAVLSIAARAGRPLSELALVMEKRPQVALKVPCGGAAFGIDAPLEAAIEEAEAALGDGGWVVVRPSGTEPIVRVTVESTDAGRAREVAEDLAARVQERLKEGKGQRAHVAA